MTSAEITKNRKFIPKERTITGFHIRLSSWNPQIKLNITLRIVTVNTTVTYIFSDFFPVDPS